MFPRYAFLARFFTGYCLIANGAYLGGGAWLDAGDSADLLQQGAHLWQLIAFGLVAVAMGLALWNGLGRHFGMRPESGRVDHAAALVAVATFAGCLLLDILAALLQAKSN